MSDQLLEQGVPVIEASTCVNPGNLLVGTSIKLPSWIFTAAAGRDLATSRSALI